MGRKKNDGTAQNIQSALNYIEQTRSKLLKAVESGEVSKQTQSEVEAGLNQAMSNPLNTNLNPLIEMFTSEQQGLTDKGRSRLATQKMFELSQDMPGRKQTLLTPRSRA